MLNINYIFFKEYLYRFFPNLYHSNTVFTYSPSLYKTLVAFSNIVYLKLFSSNSNIIFIYSPGSPKTLIASSNTVYLKLSSFIILVYKSITDILKSVFLIWI